MGLKKNLLTFFFVGLQLGTVKNSIAQNSLNKFEGKLVKIEKINSKEYYLYLKNESDTVKFSTVMPLSKDEIQLLKKTGNNISLTYYEYYNPIRKRKDKIVQSMSPHYDLK